MALTVMRFDVEMPYTSGLPEDVAVNTWHFLAQDNNGTAHTDIAAELVNFYNVVQSTSLAVSDLLSATIDRTAGAAQVTGYSLLDPTPRIPRFGPSPWTVGSASQSGRLPQEVALCLSYQAAAQSGIPQARRRGRVFVGPIGTSTADATDRPGSSYTTTWRDAGQDLLDASDAADDPVSVNTGWKWVVYSPTIAAIGGNDPLDAYALVTNGWVDDAWDTQRRRGLSPTTRSTFS